MKGNKILSKCFLTLILAVIGIAFLTPLLWMISSSLKTNPQVFASDFQWIPDVIQWKNYKKVLTSEATPILKMLGNSFFVAGCTIIGRILISAMAAYAFAVIPFKGKNIVFILLLCSMMIPTQATLIPRFMMFNWVGLYNTHAAIILPTWFNVSAIFLMRQFYQKIPKDLVESALIDGAGHFHIWLQIMTPLTKPALTSLAILALIDSWNDYLAPLVLITSKDLYTVSLGINLYNTTGDDYVNLVMTAATIVIVPVIILFTIGQKQFVEGITTSGVKG